MRKINDEEQITSKDNLRLKRARAVRDGRVDGTVFVEGLRLAEEAVKSRLEITDCFYTPAFAASQRGAKLLKHFSNARAAQISERLLASIADTKTPQGIVLLARKSSAAFELKFSASSPLVLILHKINNPANIGAILRTAEAAGVDAAILTENSAAAFAPKSLRAAAGSAFRLSVWEKAEFAAAIRFCREREIKIACAELAAEKTHFEIDWRGSRALLIGSEAHGLTADEIALCDERLKIPMKSPVESLNAAVAAGVILFEAARQRDVF
jgi:TrmH family RNA methyltransferase